MSAGLSDFFLTLPFVVAGGFAVGMTTLPTSPAAVRSMTRAGLIAASAVVVLVVATNLRALVGISSASMADLPWLAAWLIDLVTPN